MPGDHHHRMVRPDGYAPVADAPGGRFAAGAERMAPVAVQARDDLHVVEGIEVHRVGALGPGHGGAPGGAGKGGVLRDGDREHADEVLVEVERVSDTAGGIGVAAAHQEAAGGHTHQRDGQVWRQDELSLGRPPAHGAASLAQVARVVVPAALLVPQHAVGLVEQYHALGRRVGQAHVWMVLLAQGAVSGLDGFRAGARWDLKDGVVILSNH